ncbi:MAG: metallophosphoesterase [Candidatus Marinimicrobia bacterium]|nr:metallophosphoesterase [Candidatus Neomarinimicrobiota bacterium]
MADEHKFIIVGDIHGNYVELEPLLAAIGYGPAADRLIFAGDYNDHFEKPDCSTRTLIELLLEIHSAAPERVTFVRGNHDLWMADWLTGEGPPDHSWMSQGGMLTLQSYGIEPGAGADGRGLVPAAHREFFCQLIRQYYCDDRLVVVHGGFSGPRQMAAVARGAQLNTDDLLALLWNRSYIFDERPRTHEQFRRYFGERYLVTGHSPRGPWANPRNPRWLLVDSPGRGEHICAAIITGDQQVQFMGPEGPLLSSVEGLVLNPAHGPARPGRESHVKGSLPLARASH